MARTVVQIEAPANIRGRVLGVYAMAFLCCRAIAGITVGPIGAIMGVHLSLAIAAGAPVLRRSDYDSLSEGVG